MSDVIHTLEVDRGEKVARLVSWQDCEDIIETNKRLQNEPQSRNAIWRHTATIPNTIALQWLTEEWNRGNTKLKYLSEEFDRLVQRKLADPDWKWLRTG